MHLISVLDQFLCSSPYKLQSCLHLSPLYVEFIICMHFINLQQIYRLVKQDCVHVGLMHPGLN